MIFEETGKIVTVYVRLIFGKGVNIFTETRLKIDVRYEFEF